MMNKVISLIAMTVLSLSTHATNVETDRTWYLAGEPMKVTVTADDAVIAYAELCDTHGLAAGVIISLREGKGTGIVELPADLHSGYYMLSVYTRSNPEVSQQLIAVVNPLLKSQDDDIEWVEGESFGDGWKVEGGGRIPQALEHFSFNPPPSTFNPSVPELEGHIIQAHIKNVQNVKRQTSNFNPQTSIRPSLSIIGKQIHYFEGKMVNDTTAVFYTFGIHGKLPLVLSAMTSTGESLPIELKSPFAVLLPQELPHLVFHYKRSEVETRSLDMQRHQIAITPAKHERQLGDLANESAAEGVVLDYDDTVFGVKPDLSYNLDEYRQFLTIREVLLEYVIFVRKTKINGEQLLIVRRMEDNHTSLLPSLVLIDGMPVNDIEQLLNYDARRIHHINIYGGLFTFGNSVFDGILSFVTRSGRLTNYPVEPNMQYVVYEFPE